MIDGETLRDVPRDPRATAAELEVLLRRGAPGEAAAALRWHTAVGNAARVLGRLELAHRHQAQALRLAQEHGTPAQAVRARVRYAHVLQWQRRFAEAEAEFGRCLAAVDGPDGPDGPDPELAATAHFVHQHAGKCAYDQGAWTRAADRFSIALALLERMDGAGLVASSRQALDAADACATAAAVGAELHRLVPGVHRAARPRAAPLFDAELGDARPYAGVLIDLRTLLLRGPAPLPAVRAVHRYHPGLDAGLTALAGGGWLELDDATAAATPRCRALLAELMDAFDTTATALWGAPRTLLTSTEALLTPAAGTSEGAAFDALTAAGHPGTGTVAGRLFTTLGALRYHRADAHAAAWAADGLTADAVAALAADSTRRRLVEAATDRVAARPYRSLSPHQRRELLDALRALPPAP